MNMNLFVLSGLITGVTTLLLALLVLKYGDVRNGIHRTLILFNIAMVFWGFGCMFVGLSGSNAGSALFWWKIAHIGALFCVVFLLHSSLLLTGVHRKKFLIFAYVQAFFFQVLSAANILHIKLIYVFNSFYYIVPEGHAYPIFGLIWLAVGGYAIVILFSAYKHSESQKRMQIKYYLVAFLVGFLSGATHHITAFLRNDIFPFGVFSVPIMPTLITYAILRHQLLDIEVIVRKTLVFAGLLASVFAMLILPTLFIQEYLLRSAGASARLIGLTISGVIIILTMRRIETFLINITDKYLFQKKYDYKELLKTFTSEVLTVLELDKLVDDTVSKLSDIVKLNSCAVLLFDDDKQQFEVLASQNIKDASVTLIRPDGIVTFMDETHGYILVKEMHDKKIAIPSSIQEIIDKLNAELIIPMVMHDDVIGVLSLGKKKSDEEYTQDDMDILLPLARTLAIAISNAKLFVELGKTQAEAAQKEKMAVIGTLSAGINHEICNPLGIARGQCEAFLLNIKDGLYTHKTTEELLTKAKEIMGKVIHETDRATAITKKLSGFAKPAKGESEIVNIDKEIDDVLGLVGYELKLEKIEISKNIEKGLPNILVDRKQFQEVLFNLIRNAGQAIGEKGKIAITAKQDKNKVFIDIKDSGSGIPEDKIKQLFNPFFTTKDPGKGTGLGLFIVRQVVEKNGGRIHLKETKVGEGTTFTIEFPAAPEEAKAGAKSK